MINNRALNLQRRLRLADKYIEAGDLDKALEYAEEVSKRRDLGRLFRKRLLNEVLGGVLEHPKFRIEHGAWIIEIKQRIRANQKARRELIRKRRHERDAPPVELLELGVVTKFANGQSWTLDETGAPKKVA